MSIPAVQRNFLMLLEGVTPEKLLATAVTVAVSNALCASLLEKSDKRLESRLVVFRNGDKSFFHVHYLISPFLESPAGEGKCRGFDGYLL